MKILFLSNLYPPHHDATHDFPLETTVLGLKARGHVVMVLTSKHGINAEQRGGEVQRSLWLNGVHGEPAATGFSELQALEIQNNKAVTEAVAEFRPDIVYVAGLHGLSKSLLITLRTVHAPYVFQVDDAWIAEELRTDPWLRWWNSEKLPVADKLRRTSLEMCRQRDRIGQAAPTRCHQGVDRLPELFDAPVGSLPPGSIVAFPFHRLFFCSDALRQATLQAGFRVGHGEVIPPGIATETFHGPVKPPGSPFKSLMVCCDLAPRNGVMTALQALRELRNAEHLFTLEIYGRGDSSDVAQLRSFVSTHSLPVHFQTISHRNEEMPAIYRRHDALLHTSEWDEPFAIAPAEAMACGVGVIGAPSGGMAGLLRHGETALTFTPGDASELAARILEMKREPKLRCQMAETAQAEVIEKMNTTAVVDRIENYLNESLDLWHA